MTVLRPLQQPTEVLSLTSCSALLPHSLAASLAAAFAASPADRLTVSFTHSASLAAFTLCLVHSFCLVHTLSHSASFTHSAEPNEEPDEPAYGTLPRYPPLLLLSSPLLLPSPHLLLPAPLLLLASDAASLLALSRSAPYLCLPMSVCLWLSPFTSA